jgi:hypothetical protein
MSHSKRRAKGRSYYFDAVNTAAGAKYVRACRVCGHRGFDPAALENEPNRHLVEELQHLYKPLALNAGGLCDVCAVQASKPDEGV